MRRSLPLFTAVVAIAFATVLSCIDASAASSDWVTKLGGRLRLISVEQADSSGKPRYVVGLEIELEEGWKTYWRSPGDGGGVPPTVTWEDSSNLKRGVMSYPAPARFTDAIGDSIGYHDRVTFLLDVAAVDTSRPIELKAGIFVGVCKDICVPVDAELGLQLKPGETADPAIAATLQRARDAVPIMEGADGADASKGPTIGDVQATLKGATPTLTVDVKLPAGATSVDLFIESEDGSFIPLPAKAAPDANGRAMFTVDLTRAQKPASLIGKTLLLTAVTDRGALEAKRRIGK